MSDTLSQDLDERHADCAKLRAYFASHPGHELTTDEVRTVGGFNFQQRISDIRHGKDGKPKWDIRCLPQYLMGEQLVNGKYKPVKIRRIEGKWIYVPESLGRDAGQPVQQAALFDVRPRG